MKSYLSLLKKIYKKWLSFHTRISVKINYIKLFMTVDSLGKDVKVYSYPKLYHPEKISIGEKCTINSGVVIGGLGGVQIDSNVRISDGVIIHSGYLNMKNKSQHLSKPVKIGDFVWLATGSIILPGVSIGSNSVVAAGAVVTKNIPPNSLVTGVPALFQPLS